MGERKVKLECWLLCLTILAACTESCGKTAQWGQIRKSCVAKFNAARSVPVLCGILVGKESAATELLVV